MLKEKSNLEWMLVLNESISWQQINLGNEMMRGESHDECTISCKDMILIAK